MTDNRTLNDLALEQIASETHHAAGFTRAIAEEYLDNGRPLTFGGHEVTIQAVAPVRSTAGNTMGWCGTALADDGVTINWYIDGADGTGDAFVQPCLFRL